jgi:hypothetical protein
MHDDLRLIFEGIRDAIDGYQGIDARVLDYNNDNGYYLPRIIISDNSKVLAQISPSKNSLLILDISDKLFYPSSPYQVDLKDPTYLDRIRNHIKELRLKVI